MICIKNKHFTKSGEHLSLIEALRLSSMASHYRVLQVSKVAFQVSVRCDRYGAVRTQRKKRLQPRFQRGFQCFMFINKLANHNILNQYCSRFDLAQQCLHVYNMNGNVDTAVFNNYLTLGLTTQ